MLNSVRSSQSFWLHELPSLRPSLAARLAFFFSLAQVLRFFFEILPPDFELPRPHVVDIRGTPAPCPEALTKKLRSNLSLRQLLIQRLSQMLEGVHALGDLCFSFRS